MESSRHGFGNWTDIADFINTNKTREEVEEHYLTVYLGAPNYIPVFQSIFRLLRSSQKETLMERSQLSRIVQAEGQGDL